MSARAAFANLAWLASSLPAHRRFRTALASPEATQLRWLRRHLARHARTAYGQACGVPPGADYGEFARRVPIVGYDALAPWIERIRRGDTGVLTADPVTRLLPTSGSTGARKLIPFTAQLQREFNAAIGPWLVDLGSTFPSLPFGSAYWSVTPMGEPPDDGSSAVPIGFDDDSRYLGPARAWLVEAAMAVPPSVRHLRDLTTFRRTVLRHLLARGDLRLISVWHPSFLLLLLETLEHDWDLLLRELPGLASPARCRALHAADPTRAVSVWPALRVISTWADALAAGPAAEVQRRFPGVVLQAKGLLATEAFITLPFAGTHPLAVTSHFFEFRDQAGDVHPVSGVRTGEIYELIITTGGGLWRYALGDQVKVTGFLDRTPTLRFLGRTGNVSDLCGEKLTDAFVAGLMPELAPAARFVLLAPEPSGSIWHYTLFIEVDPSPPDLAGRLDAALQANPHYALCRRLGQLGPARVAALPPGAYERFVAEEVAGGRRLGDFKPTALSRRTDWRERLCRSSLTPGRHTASASP